MRKKILAMLLSACMVVSLSACGNKENPSDPTTAPTPTVAGEEGGNDDGNQGTGTGEGDETGRPAEPMGQIIIGDTTALAGDWEGTWQNNGADKTVRDLTTGYETVTADQSGSWVWDENVVKSHKETVNDDGSKTFEITLQEDLLYNDGTPITAADYVARVYFYSSPANIKSGGRGTAGMSLIGFEDYQKEAKTNPAAPFKGLRLLDKYTFSITVDPEYIPYYYDITYASVYPFPVHAWFPDVEVKDDGNGVYFTNFTEDGVQDQITKYRFFSDNRVSSGPYTIKSFDKSSQQATLEVNPNYKGNFEGQKPSIKTIVYVLAESETQIDALKTGGIDILKGLSEGAEIDAGLDLVEAGGFNFSKYDRNGYGKLMFVCDFGPTQFKAVRQAIAHLLDRNDFAKTFTGGYGSLVDGPYGLALWQYKEAEEELSEKLNSYAYSFDTAKQLLEEDGWVYGADGKDYSSGIRYKKVTKEEAGTYEGNVTLADGTILMPLIINWCASTGNPVSELLKVKLVENPDVTNAGMKINQTMMEYTQLQSYMYRDASKGDEFATPKYGMFNLATGFTAIYDYAYNWTLDPEFLSRGFNQNYLLDEKMDKLSMDMVYAIEPGDDEAYLKLWVEYIEYWNELVPELPLYSNIYHDVYVDRLKNYNPSAMWEFGKEIIYAYVTK